jgi:hypothetical protein
MWGLIPANLSGMPNDLVPEVRVDKNGVPVTRHVRHQKGSTGKSIPKPVVAALEASKPYPERESDIKLIFGECEEFFEHGGIGTDDFLRALNGYSDHTVRTIKKYMGDSEHQTYYAELTAMIGHAFPELDVREYMMYSFEAADCQDLKETSQYIRGLHHYKSLKGIEDFTRVDPETEAVSRALIRIAFNLHCMQDDDHPAAVYVDDPRGTNERTPVIKSPSLISLITDNPSRSNDVAVYIEDHGFKSTKVLAQMIEGTHRATRDGFL